ncbi:MAG: Hsp70 family protein [Zetaproteobacteria bacterium]|nr:Hsp70 family protein [Zetaproteobacteria bacterium]
MQQTPHRYVIGIDLGTSTSALAYVDLSESQPVVRELDVLQWSGKEQLVAQKLLPSQLLFPRKLKSYPPAGLSTCAYLPEKHPLAESRVIVGEAARLSAYDQPERVVQSAKSWLGSTPVADEQPLLPWQSPVVQEPIDPIEASSYYLAYLAATWNREKARYVEEDLIFRQKVYLTLPASFSAAAIERTLDAAQRAGFDLGHLQLVEEPIAAAYASAFACHGPLQQYLAPAWQFKGQGHTVSKHVLVIDVGGGTTDFSLLQLHTSATEEQVGWRRVAVSPHILLGGDNIDLFIAHRLAAANPCAGGWNGRLWNSLVRLATELKAKLFAPVSEQVAVLRASIQLPAEKLFAASSIQVEIERESLVTSILEAFFPHVDRECGLYDPETHLVEWGLPYATDSRITAHIANFLCVHQVQQVDGVLFHGGTLIPDMLRHRILDSVSSWQVGPRPQELPSAALDTGVAQGAATYGWLLACKQERYTRQECSKNYFLLLGSQGSASRLLCIRPRGTDNHKQLSVAPEGLVARMGQQVRFALIEETDHQGFQAGDLVADPQLCALEPSVCLVSSMGHTPCEHDPEAPVDVVVTSSFSPSGSLVVALGCKQHPESTLATLDFVDSGESAPTALSRRQVEPSRLQAPLQVFLQAFKMKLPTPKMPDLEKALKRPLDFLEQQSKIPRDKWNLAELREMFDVLLEVASQRRRSPNHERAFLQLVGFAQRPGFGDPQDARRMEVLWRIYLQGICHRSHPHVANSWYALWRRVAGGLTVERQQKVFRSLYPKLKQADLPEQAVMCLASFERVPAAWRTDLVESLARQFQRGRSTPLAAQKMWGLARLCSRVMLYSSADCALSTDVISHVVQQVVACGWISGIEAAQGHMLRSCMRETPLAHLSIAVEHRQQVESFLRKGPRVARPQGSRGENILFVARQELAALLGDSIPPGLEIHGVTAS